MLDHWHPLCLASRVRRKPLAVKLAGQELVVFRTDGGRIGVLNDACPHRRMRLSTGAICGDRLRCPYHATVRAKAPALPA